MRHVRFLAAISALALSVSTLSAGGNSESQSQLLRQLNSLASGTDTRQTDQIQQDMSSLTMLYRYVDSLYYEDVDKQVVKESLATAMLDALGDKYSFYTPKDETEDYEEQISGKYGGIGVYLSKPSPKNIDPDDPSTYMVTIDSPFKGSPAQRAGLISGDMISAIDGEPVRDMTSSEASKKVRGEAGTEVTLTIVRDDSSFDITLVRETIDSPVVEGTMLEDHIGYIAVSSYTTDVSQQFLEKVRELKGQGMESLIIDERNNGGGNVNEALKMADIFLPSGATIVTMEGRKGTNSNQRYVSDGSQQIGQNLPVVILINGGTASASEIFAAALHDNDRATLIGTKSFGKGIFQTVFPFGEGYVQLTTGHYYTPKGINIHGTGIEPDIESADTKLAEDQIPAYEQMMKEKAPQEFVKTHPEYTMEHVQEFVEENKERGIDEAILKVLVRNEYYSKRRLSEMPVADPAYDSQLARAISFFVQGQ